MVIEGIALSLILVDILIVLKSFREEVEPLESASHAFTTPYLVAASIVEETI